MQYLYCRDGLVIAWYEEAQKYTVPKSAHGGDSVSIIPWPNVDSLQRNAHGLFIAPSIEKPEELAAYARHQHDLLVSGHIEVNIGTKKEPKPVLVGLSQSSLGLLHGAHILERGAEYVQDDGISVHLTPTQVRAVVSAAHTHMQSASSTLAQILAAIKTGTITSQSDIDTPPDPIPAWPAR